MIRSGPGVSGFRNSEVGMRKIGKGAERVHWRLSNSNSILFFSRYALCALLYALRFKSETIAILFDPKSAVQNLKSKRLQLPFSEDGHQQPEAHNCCGKKKQNPDQRNAVNEGGRIWHDNQRRSDNQRGNKYWKWKPIRNPIVGCQHVLKPPMLKSQAELFLANQVGQIEQLVRKLPQKLK